MCIKWCLPTVVLSQSIPAVYSLLQLWLYRLLSRNETIATRARPHSEAATSLRPNFYFLHAPHTVATTMLSPHTMISCKPLCDLLSLSRSLSLFISSLSLLNALMKIFFFSVFAGFLFNNQIFWLFTLKSKQWVLYKLLFLLCASPSSTELRY